MSNSAPWITPDELSEIIELIDKVRNSLFDKISLGTIEVYDINGETLGHVIPGDEQNTFVFQPTKWES